jgi:hypothetical protein
MAHFTLNPDGALIIFDILKAKGIKSKEIFETIDDRIKILQDDEYQCKICNKRFESYNIEELLSLFYYHNCRVRINLRK